MWLLKKKSNVMNGSEIKLQAVIWGCVSRWLRDGCSCYRNTASYFWQLTCCVLERGGSQISSVSLASDEMHRKQLRLSDRKLWMISPACLASRPDTCDRSHSTLRANCPQWACRGSAGAPASQSSRDFHAPLAKISIALLSLSAMIRTVHLN